jgi:sugar fermentation stimulation protein A
MITYNKTEKGVFLERPNRFIAKVLINGNEETVHVKNTGRCKELLVKGCTVVVSESDNPSRKTKYDLIAVYKTYDDGTSILINMDSQVPNAVAAEWLEKGSLFSKNAIIKREVTFENSRFDIYVEDGDRRAFVEVKGVTLENNGTALFPDAPTLRGIKHLNELAVARSRGFEAYVLFIVQMKGVFAFKPNDAMHAEFGDALRKACEKGVKALAVDCAVTENSISGDLHIPVVLDA